MKKNVGGLGMDNIIVQRILNTYIQPTLNPDILYLIFIICNFFIVFFFQKTIIMI